MFRLTKKEKDELVTNCDRFKPLKHSAVSPRAFTEKGVAMLSSVVNSHRAIEVNIAIMRAFVHLRKMIASQTELAKKLKELEHHIKDHDEKIQKIITIQPINYLTNRPALLYALLICVNLRNLLITLSFDPSADYQQLTDI